VEGFAGAVVFNDTRHDQFGGFERRITFFTLYAFPASAYLLTVGNQTGVDDFGFWMGAKRTMHTLKSVPNKGE
jgi:hypothetical protein